ncbi:MAG: GDSL family lipase [Lachnospiraceae bacterium]|nr:GDSL family lipase [Lachnospiraceae bacterium]
MKIEWNENTVKYIGRTVIAKDCLLLSLSGSGIEFEYEGKGLTLTLLGGSASQIPENEGNYARMAVYVDGVRVHDLQLKQCETRLRVAESETTKKSVITVLKLSECAMSLAGIAPLEIADGETVRPTPNQAHRIEFIGDSITCGYGIDDEDPLHPFKTATEDVTRAYAYKTAKALGADYSMFSTSGYGIISGYTGDPAIKMENQRIPDFYESMGFSYDLMPGFPAPMELPWNFAAFAPDAIVINLGTNDDSYCQDFAERQMEYANAYTAFLKKVRKNNPGAMLICVLGLMGDRLYPFVCKAAKAYSDETGDLRITTVHLPEQDASKGYVSDYHPLESAHEKAASVLIPAVREAMNW